MHPFYRETTVTKHYDELVEEQYQAAKKNRYLLQRMPGWQRSMFIARMRRERYARTTARRLARQVGERGN